ncbi:hypothetical protein BGX21_003540 [Mortierella sp. AD011]|nr:hypothetical protein BGX20_009765 [Mortierella sp. AD010]KAF9400772.1 hypothetical protein BGX21_003540 [Mortierella sp. AD011]
MLQSIRAFPPRNAYQSNHGQYRIQHWATFLTSVPKRHHYVHLQQQQQQTATSRRLYATKTVHEKAARKVSYAPKPTYQPTAPATWIISDGSVGADKEAIALAKGLQLPWAVKRVEWRRAGLGVMKDQKNYFRVNSTLNSITPKSLESSKSKALECGLIPKSYFDNGRRSSSPIVTVLIGGPSEDCSHNTERIVNRLARLVDVQNCRVLISFSQRTAGNTKQAIAQLQERIQDQDKLFVYDPMIHSGATANKGKDDASVSWSAIAGPKGLTGFLAGHNPYEAMLALADKVVVTADSIAMTNEALAAGKSVYILGGELARGKLKVFHRHLADLHFTRAFRPGRIPIVPISHQNDNKNTTATNNSGNDTADPLSYPGDHPAWNCSLAGKGPGEIKKLVERLQILRECRLAGRRVPEHIADATS